MAMLTHRRAGEARRLSRAMTSAQMVPRRRNPKGGRHFAGARFKEMPVAESDQRIGRPLQSAGHDARILFSAPC